MYCHEASDWCMARGSSVVRPQFANAAPRLPLSTLVALAVSEERRTRKNINAVYYKIFRMYCHEASAWCMATEQSSLVRRTIHRNSQMQLPGYLFQRL
jgi:hypothetical protein